MKKTSNLKNSQERKRPDSELNKWVKQLPTPKKKIFFEKLWGNDLLWLHRDKNERKTLFNNYRYSDVATPIDINMILIYITARYADPDLKIHTIFPDISESYIEKSFRLLPILIQESLDTNNFNRKYAQNKTKQPHFENA